MGCQNILSGHHIPIYCNHIRIVSETGWNSELQTGGSQNLPVEAHFKNEPEARPAELRDPGASD